MTDAKLAVVTGASSGIGKELAKLCAKDGYNLVVAADEPAIQQAAEALGSHNIAVEAVEADLATVEGVDRLISRIGERDIDLLFLNAGRGLGNGFVDQDWGKIRRIIDTNITGTVYLAHELGAKMARRGRGRILFTGSIAGFMPGTFQAVYNGTKAFIDSFAIALRHELQDTGVTVTVLMPGATQTRFFERAEMMDTKVGTDEKDNPADVAKAGYEAMMTGEEQVVSGWKNKLQVAAAHVTPAGTLAEQHREMAAPGSASQD
ncbi:MULTISPECIES: SDR family NAD(P)-dependent oxidoreductase [unclassified Mesorhizobium]|uniref:SDR family NAD(P)-dependent oxidoreductase n=1 Tax=unclassified Mesorhizobium TaxID=325217 RepID=UPI0011284E8A|nr:MULTISPECIES: SDR family NAD(P)-dependent oxidoreductase [unclassified Mesorhizobium]MBZ9917176.1 SDR family NAD(P)-dependent oxidoreductase [Mesorhizobium sp. BR1-1-7]MBZ9951760.1 SDR family NAD(P)-dependent oxidoreductase [Mesorhizobium sp. BR1-1-15]MBZ9961493.1 SDR family NAD(P)-dependent oxidoreductase [Mesorhizobium sp. BR1-1-14]MBZ9972153.1 SDR family NAD(P)-dependent oxidoreductase [Mesorhizobium sp. BR1-1-12]MBZ9984606.1 SDR family NAD(P)-dependent oxidoreductase [Mesorhizobium sp. 